MSNSPKDKMPEEVWESMPSAEDIWPNDKYQYAPVEKYVRDITQEYSTAQEFADLECARLLANMLYEPPLMDDEITDYAKKFGLNFKQAQEELRRRRK